MAETVGLIARFLGVVLALAVGFLVWGGPVRSGAKVERLVEAALFLEGTYFVLLFPISHNLILQHSLEVIKFRHFGFISCFQFTTKTCI